MDHFNYHLQPPQKKTWHPALGLSMMGTYNLLDKLAYYGARSVLLFYMLQGLLISQEIAMSYYGYFVTAIAIFSIVGGILGDFAIPPVICLIIGSGLQTLGCFVLALPGGQFSLLAGLLLLIFSTAFSKANTLKQTADLYTGRSEYLTAGYSVQYFAITLGASLAGMLFADKGHNSFSVIFVFAGIISLLSIIPLIIGYRTFMQHSKEAAKEKIATGATEIISFILVLFSFPFFWAGLELLEQQMMDAPRNSSSIFDFQTLSASLTVAISGLLFPLLFSFLKINPLIKISSGFFIMIFTFILSFAFRELFLASAFLSAFSEALISIPSYSAIALYAPRQLRGVFFSLTPLLSFLAGKMAGFAQSHIDVPGSGLLTAILTFIFFLFASGFMVLAILLHLKNKKNKIIPPPIV